jgi:hypothetical protein
LTSSAHYMYKYAGTIVTLSTGSTAFSAVPT